MTFEPDLFTLVAKVYGGASLTIARSVSVLRFIDLHMWLLRKNIHRPLNLYPSYQGFYKGEGAKKFANDLIKV